MSTISMRDGYTSDVLFFVCDLKSCSRVAPAEHNGTDGPDGKAANLTPKGWIIPQDALGETPPLDGQRPIYCCVAHWLEAKGRCADNAEGINERPVDVTLARELPKPLSLQEALHGR